MPITKCKHCHTQFYVKPSHVKLGYGKYCSMACKHQGQKTGKFVICETCEKETWKTPKAIRNSKSGRFFCDKSCQTLWRNQHYSGEKHPNWKGGMWTYQHIMKINKILPLCQMCNTDNKKVLVVHHKDQNRKNNTVKNLMWLCRNCHYLIHNGKTL